MDTSWSQATKSQGISRLTNLAGRRAAGQVRSLDGTWRAILDPYDTGLINILGERNKQGFYRDFKPRHPADRVEYDFDTSLELQVPGDWNTQHPELLYYEGAVWYRRLVEVSASQVAAEDERQFLHFGAVNHTSRVFLDGEELATHVGGFGPFSVEVTGRLGVGTHSLVVQVDNRREPQRIPAMRSDWWNFGGIHRSVDLVTVPATALIDAWLTMAADGSLVGGVEVDGDTTNLHLTITVAGDTVVEEALTGAEHAVTVAHDEVAALERWSPNNPTLHPVTWTLTRSGDVVDQLGADVGLRTIATDGNKIVLNGEPIYLKGISLHAEAPSGGRRAAGAEDAETLLGWASDLNANFVRLGHYQHDEAMVAEADRRGLLVWGELPVYWGIEFDNPDTTQNALEQAAELVRRDRSRASVVLWSAANETLPGPERQAFIGSILTRFRELDPTRLTTAALLTLPSNDPAVHIDDPLGEHVDVIGVNQYMGWYYASRESMAETTWTSDFGKPMIFSELGAGAKYGHHGDENEIWTEEFQAAVYRAQIEMIARTEDCAGLSPWILKDFRTPLRVLPGIQDGYNRKGLVSEEGERKLAFDVLAGWYASLG